MDEADIRGKDAVRQNVEGGFGFVGSMRFRKRPVEEVR